MHQAAALVSPVLAPSRRADSDGRASRHLVAAALGLAGAIHVALTPEHFEESTLFGIVFVTIAAVQLSLAVALVRRPGPRVRQAALLTTLGLVAVWAGTRLIRCGAPLLSFLGTSAVVTSYTLTPVLLATTALLLAAANWRLWRARRPLPKGVTDDGIQ